MLTAKQGEIVIDLIRRMARVFRQEQPVGQQLVHSLLLAQEARVPDRFMMPLTSGLRGLNGGACLDESALPPAVGSLFNKTRRCSAENLAALESFAAAIKMRFGADTEDAILAGDGAALAGLYQDPGAFPASDWEALLKDGTCANGDKPQQLGPPSEDWSEKVQFGDARWRRPKPALLITLLARHVGDPTAPPTPPMWPHLGLALLVWKDRVAVTEVLELGSRIGRKEEVERGLVIAAHIFPELEKWATPNKLGIPAWERKLAVPFAARRLVLSNYE